MNLRAVFKQLKKKKKKKKKKEKKNTLNKVKCDYGKKKFVVFGHVFSDDGISPDSNKITVWSS